MDFKPNSSRIYAPMAESWRIGNVAGVSANRRKPAFYQHLRLQARAPEAVCQHSLPKEIGDRQTVE
jgi:hypothetical protein